MIRKFISIPFFAVLLLMGPAACQPLAAPAAAVENPTDEQPLPQAGENASPLGPAALTIEEQRSDNTFSIIPVSADTGSPVAGIQPVVLGGDIAYGFSKDRSQMAFLSNRTEGCLTYCLRIMDLHEWEEMVDPIPVEKSMSAWFVVPEFDVNSDIIPLILNKQTDTVSEALLVSRSHGKVVARNKLPASIFQAVFTPQGSLAVYGLQTNRSGTEPLTYLALLDGKNLDLLWELTIPEIPLSDGNTVDYTDPTQGMYYQPARVFSPDGSKLYLVAADKPLLVTVDLQNRTLKTARIQPKVNLLERILAGTASVVYAKTMNGISKAGVLSQDGRYLYVVGEETKAVETENGEFEMERIPLGLQVIDTRDGTLVRSVDNDANQLWLSQDGKLLLLNGWREGEDGSVYSWTDVMDTSSWKVIQRLEGMGYPSRLLDGSLVWLVVEETVERSSTIALYRPGSPKPSAQITRSAYVDWIQIP